MIDYIEKELLEDGYKRLTLEEAKELENGVELKFYTGYGSGSMHMYSSMDTFWEKKYVEGKDDFYMDFLPLARVSDFWIKG